MDDDLEEPGLYIAPEKGEKTMDSVESFAKDKDISELLEMLSKMKDQDGYHKLMDTVSYVDSLENTLSSMMKQIIDMREEIKSVHEQNEYLMSRAERGVKDVLSDQLRKAETKVQELHAKLIEIKDNIKSFAINMVQKAKIFGNRALLKLADLTHIKRALEGVRNKADKMVGSLESLSDMVEGYKANTKQAAERREEVQNIDSYRQDIEPVAAVAEERTYQEMSQPLSYEEAMEQFMVNRVSEGVTYSCNQDAYEDFKAYYDKKLKADSMAGVHRDMQFKASEKSR